MPTGTSLVHPSDNAILLLLADGGALQDLNQRLRVQEAMPQAKQRVDFLKLPDAARQSVLSQDKFATIECPREGRILFVVGSDSGASFLERMGVEWHVETLPLGLCRYERSAPLDKEGKLNWKLRFHALISYHLGFLTATLAKEEGRRLIVGVVSDDPQLIPAMADARKRGLDVRFVWFPSSVSEEFGYFAARNNIPLLQVPIETSLPEGQGLAHLDQLTSLLR